VSNCAAGRLGPNPDQAASDGGCGESVSHPGFGISGSNDGRYNWYPTAGLN